MSQQYSDGDMGECQLLAGKVNSSVRKFLIEQRVSRRNFLLSSGAALASAPLMLSLSGIARAAGSAAASTPSLPAPVIFPGNGIGAQFNSYGAPPTPYGFNFSADVFDRCYFPGQKAQLKLTFSNAGGPPPAPWTGQDIGAVGNAGSVLYAKGQFTVKGSGADIWTPPDQFYYVFQPCSGDIEVIAHVASFQGSDGGAKAGIMLRQSLDPSADFADVFVTPAFGPRVEIRDKQNGQTGVNGPSITAPYWVKLQRTGSTITGSISPDGKTWTVIQTYTTSIASAAYIGLLVCGHTGGLATAVYDQVSINGVPVTATGSSADITVNGDVIIAFSTEVLADTNGGVQLTPVEVTRTIPIPATVVPAGGTASIQFGFDASDPATRKGVYAIFANIRDSTNPTATTSLWLGNIAVIYPPTPGFKEHSPFMGDTSSNDFVSMDIEATTMQKLGVKWCRNGIGWDQMEATKGTIDFTNSDTMVNLFKKHELYMLWLGGSSPDWARDGVTYPVRTGSGSPDLAIPDDHLADWTNYWHAFAQHYTGSTVRAINVWNEPWEGGGISGWGGTSATYRKMIKGVYQGVKSVDPSILVGGCDSDDNINDVLLPDPDWQHSFDLATQHGGGVSGDYIQRLVPYPVWNTESWYFAQSAPLIQHMMFLHTSQRKKMNTLVLGNFFSGVTDAGNSYSYDPGNPVQFSPQPSSVSYSTLTHLLEDLEFQQELDPGHVPYTFLFKGQQHSVAVLFGFVSPSNSRVPEWQITGAGKMRLPDPWQTLTALDVYGNPYQREADGSYLLPFDLSPIYVIDSSYDRLQRSVGQVRVEQTNTPVRIVLDDLVQPLEEKPELAITIINPLRQRLSGTVQVALPAGWNANKTSFSFHELLPGEKVKFSPRLLQASYNDTNQYPITVTVTTTPGTMVWKENIEVHVIPFGTPQIQATTTAQSEWTRLGIHPITIGSVTPPTPQTNWAYCQVGLSYDARNLYFIAAVNSPNINPSIDANSQWYTLIPPGYGYADGPHWPFDGDNVQLGINCFDNATDYLYPKDNPLHYRYPSRETDYLFGFYWPTGTNGQVWRYRLPGFPWRHRYPFTPFQYMQQVVDPDVKLTVSHNGNWYTYWAAVPLSLLTKLRVDPHSVIKLAVKHSNSNVGDVFSSQNRSSSRRDEQAFQPFWAGAYSIDTLWGFGRKPS